MLRPVFRGQKALDWRSHTVKYVSNHLYLRRTAPYAPFSSAPEYRDVPTKIFSGIQPTGVPHLGNYLGALRNWVKLQDEGKPDDIRLFSIVDLHALTGKQDRIDLVKWRFQTLYSLLAVGLKPTKSIIFFQSDVPAHCELLWLLSCSASVGHLSRMTQWKSKLGIPDDAPVGEGEEPLSDRGRGKSLKLGLFSYPVLQAADILVHGANAVPVGQDQVQHLEFTRDLANSFNSAYQNPHNDKPVFELPRTILSPAKKIMSLRNPAQKMSKSDPDPQSTVLITDDEATIRAKIGKAVTDSINGISYDPENRPGVSNLIQIMYYLEEDESGSCGQLAERYKDIGMKEFKEVVAECINRHLKPIRDRYELLSGKPYREMIKDIRSRGGHAARQNAYQNMLRIKKAVGVH